MPVGDHLADQLVLLSAIAEPGSVVRTLRPSLHTRTNVEVLNQFLGRDIVTLEARDDAWWLERPASK